MFYNWASDPEVTKYLTWPAYTGMEDARKITALWAEENKDLRKYQWAIVPKELAEPIGSISAKTGAFHAVCSTKTDIYQLIFQDLKGLYDI